MTKCSSNDLSFGVLLGYCRQHLRCLTVESIGINRCLDAFFVRTMLAVIPYLSNADRVEGMEINDGILYIVYSTNLPEAKDFAVEFVNRH